MHISSSCIMFDTIHVKPILLVCNLTVTSHRKAVCSRYNNLCTFGTLKHTTWPFKQKHGNAIET